jgi:hypothetical protein
MGGEASGDAEQAASAFKEVAQQWLTKAPKVYDTSCGLAPIATKSMSRHVVGEGHSHHIFKYALQCNAGFTLDVLNVLAECTSHLIYVLQNVL